MDKTLLQIVENGLNSCEDVCDFFEGEQFSLTKINDLYVFEFYNGMYGNMCSVLFRLYVLENFTQFEQYGETETLALDDQYGLYDLACCLGPDRVVENPLAKEA